MNKYHSARQGIDRKWRYTCKIKNHEYPIGYCTYFIPLTKELCTSLHEKYDIQRNRELSKFSDKYHGNEGHDTQEEAEDCYYEYILDNEIKHITALIYQMNNCSIETCNERSIEGYETKEKNYIWLCPKHNTKEVLKQYIPFPSGLIIIEI